MNNFAAYLSEIRCLTIVPSLVAKGGGPQFCHGLPDSFRIPNNWMNEEDQTAYWSVPTHKLQ